MRSADANYAVGQECVRRHFKVSRRRTFTDPPRRVVVRTVAWAEPAFVIAFDFTRFLTKRHTAEMRTNANDNQKLSFWTRSRPLPGDEARHCRSRWRALSRPLCGAE